MVIKTTGTFTGGDGKYIENTAKEEKEYELDQNANLKLTAIYTEKDNWVYYEVIFIQGQQTIHSMTLNRLTNVSIGYTRIHYS